MSILALTAGSLMAEILISLFIPITPFSGPSPCLTACLMITVFGWVWMTLIGLKKPLVSLSLSSIIARLFLLANHLKKSANDGPGAKSGLPPILQVNFYWNLVVFVHLCLVYVSVVQWQSWVDGTEDRQPGKPAMIIIHSLMGSCHPLLWGDSEGFLHSSPSAQSVDSLFCNVPTTLLPISTSSLFPHTFSILLSSHVPSSVQLGLF